MKWFVRILHSVHGKYLWLYAAWFLGMILGAVISTLDYIHWPYTWLVAIANVVLFGLLAWRCRKAFERTRSVELDALLAQARALLDDVKNVQVIVQRDAGEGAQSGLRN